MAQAEADAGYSSLADAINRGDTGLDDSGLHSPVATADTYSVNEDATLTVTAANGVLKNDTDADKDKLTAAIVTQPAHGTLTMKGDGSFIYKPTANYSGTDTFTYTRQRRPLRLDPRHRHHHRHRGQRQAGGQSRFLHRRSEREPHDHRHQRRAGQ